MKLSSQSFFFFFPRSLIPQPRNALKFDFVRALAATGKFFDDEHDDTEATLSPLSDSGALLIALVGRQVA